MIACPVAAVKAWLEAAAITDGPVFRPVAKGGRIQATRLTDRSVADIVKARAQRAGLDPKLFAGHSLRSGFLTSAAARGASIFKMADQSRHKSMDTLRGYVRDAEIFKDQRGKDCCRGATLDHRVVRARAPKQATEPIHRRDSPLPRLRNSWSPKALGTYAFVEFMREIARRCGSARGSVGLSAKWPCPLLAA